MSDYNFPCPVCCKHIIIKADDFKKGGIFKCRSCGNQVKLKGHKDASDKQTQK